MALAMKLGVMGGRLGYLAGKAKTVEFAQPSSPLTGLSTNKLIDTCYNLNQDYYKFLK